MINNSIKDILKKYRYFCANLLIFLLYATFCFCDLTFDSCFDDEILISIRPPLYGIGVAKLVSYLSPFVFIVLGIITAIFQNLIDKKVKSKLQNIIMHILVFIILLGIGLYLLNILPKLTAPNSFIVSSSTMFYIGSSLLTRSFQEAKNNKVEEPKEK